MAMTTFATSLSLIEDTVLGELITEYIIKPDKVMANIPLVTAPSLSFRQKLISEPTGAAATRFDEAFSPSAFTEFEYDAFLNYIQKSDNRLEQIDSVPAGTSGMSDRTTKMNVCVKAVAKLARQYSRVGQPATVAIGSDLTTAGITAVEVGPRAVTLNDVEGGSAVSTRLGYLKWSTSSNLLSYSSDGVNYGDTVTISATNFHRVFLRAANRGQWIRLTCVAATLMAASDFTTTSATNGLTYTPSTQPTGLVTQIDPDLVMFGNLSASNPTATGDALSQKNLAWLRSRLLDGSNGDPGSCAILMPTKAYLNAEVLISGLGGGTSAVEFMGTRFNSLNYGSIPIFEDEFVEDNRTAANTSTTGLCDVVGLIFGEEKAHLKYAGGTTFVTATGELSSLPISFFEKDPGTSKKINMVADMTYEPMFGSVHSGAMLTDITQ
jgi:hypothetical protein